MTDRNKDHSFHTGEIFDTTIAFISNEIAKLGRHLPKKREVLSHLLNSKKPGYISQTGDFYHIRREEILSLANLVPQEYHEKIKLPLVFLKDKNLVRLSGTKVESWIIEKILDEKKEFPVLLEVFKPRESYYNYEFQRIRRAFPTTTTFTLIRIS